MEQLKIEFETLRQSIRAKIDTRLPQLTSSESAQERRLVINQAARDLEEADELVAEMEFKAKTLPHSDKLKATALVRTWRESIRVSRKDLQKAGGDTSQADRAQLLSGASSSHVVNINSSDNNQRTRLLKGTDQLQTGTERLMNIQRIAAETEEVGVNTLSDLNRQREQIVRTRDTLSGADTWIAQSTGVLRGMQWQITKGSLIQKGTIVVLVILILIAIYFKYIR
ncbi:hypothetical protein BDR26DRAFT_857089 [Obelidium mucronatum]|nr:hypothetical protein BDR26DRAFT_857089 [Obelidium mucronatum]